MTPSAVQLAEGFYPQDIRPWYDGAAVGEILTIAVSSRETAVRLIRQPNNHVRWWPEGGRGMAMTLEDAMLRLEMLRDTRSGLRRTATEEMRSRRRVPPL